MDSRAEFDAKDMALLDQAHRETEAAEAAASTPPPEGEVAAVDEGTGKEQPAATPPAAPAPTEPGAAPAAPAAATPAAPAVADAQGSAKAALRASRHAEKLLRDEVSALRKRIEESGGNAHPADATKPDETQLNDVREYAPAVGKHLDALERENAELRARVTTSDPAAGFVPELMPPDVQAGIDDVPELLLWHSSAEHQDKWQAAKSADGLLAQSPLWRGKPFSERFAAAVELVKQQVAAPSKASTTAKTLEDAQRVIAAAAAAPAAPLTLGDLRGGATPASNPTRDYHAMKKAGATDEDIIASLPELP